MTSRERIRAALQHEAVDRIPLDLGSTFVTGICLPAYTRLISYLGLPKRECFIIDPMQMLCQIDEDVMDMLHIDVVGIHPVKNSFGSLNTNYINWEISPELSCRIPSDLELVRRFNGNWEYIPPGGKSPSAVMPAGQAFFDLLTRNELKDVEDLRAGQGTADGQAVFHLIPDEELRQYEAESFRLARETEYGVVANLNICALGGYLRIVSPDTPGVQGIGDPKLWYIALLLNPSYIQEFFARQTEMALKNLALLKQAFGERVDAIFVSGTDFGTQNSLMFSQSTFTSLYKPYYTQHTLPYGTKDEVVAEVKKNLSVLSRDGGCVFNPVHNIQADVPAENIAAAYKTAMDM